MSFIFQMDANEEHYIQQQQQQPVASTSTSSPPSTSSKILLDYAPKPIQTHSQSPSPERGINAWLASQGSSYYPHDQRSSRGNSPRRARPNAGRSFAIQSSNNSSDSDSSDSESELQEEDAIFLQPRRHLSRQGSAMTSPVSRPAPSPYPVFQQKKSSSAHHHLHLTAQRPALPVVDLSAASGHVELELDFLPLDKSHWSDDESDIAYSDDDDEEDDLDADADVDEDGLWGLHPDELDVPALVDDDEGNPASTSTRSIPIPSATKDISSRVGLMSRRLRPCFDVESPPTRRKSTDGQNFWTPWMDQYLADAAAAR